MKAGADQYRRMLLLQTPCGAEGRALITLAALRDIPCRFVAIEDLVEHMDALESGAVPVGSVRFLRVAMGLLRLPEPPALSYPAPMLSYLRRSVVRCEKGEIPASCTDFVKPAAEIKAFTGFRLNTPEADPSAEAYRLEQQTAFSALPEDTPVWLSSPVRFVAEWRYYVLRDRVIGHARYDPYEDDVQPPDEKLVHNMVDAWREDPSRPCAYGLDVGILDDGQPALVEVNDAWALGFYSDMKNADGYYQMLTARWQELMKGSAC